MHERNPGDPGRLYGLDNTGGDRTNLERIIGQLVGLADNEEACRVLGVDGRLSEEVDITFLDDPVDYLAYDIASTYRDAIDEDASATPGPLLSLLVAEMKLYRAMSGSVDQQTLVSRALENLRQLQG